MAIPNRENIPSKEQRIDLRTTAQVKETLERAAKLSGATLSAFMLEASYEKARNLIKENEVILLTNKERDRIMSLLNEDIKDIKVNPKLKSAMERYLKKDEK
jgi:uncharacterized protein (DUF1778 family)